MKWERGRQETGYKKLKLFQFGTPQIGGMDIHLLRYDAGDFIPEHTDPVTGKRHYRINLEITRAEQGGILYVDKPILRFGRLTIFRSDLSKHSVSLVEIGKRYVLSMGVAI